MDYFTKISEIFDQLNDEILNITRDEFQFFEEDSFKAAAETYLVPSYLSDQPEIFWDLITHEGKVIYEDEFQAILVAIEACAVAVRQNKKELKKMKHGQIKEWIEENSANFHDIMSGELRWIRKILS